MSYISEDDPTLIKLDSSEDESTTTNHRNNSLFQTPNNLFSRPGRTLPTEHKKQQFPFLDLPNMVTSNNNNDGGDGTQFVAFPAGASLLDFVPNPHKLPRNYYTGRNHEVDMDAYQKYSREYNLMREEAERLLRGYYDSTLEAEYAITTYIVCLDHADESIDFAIRQFNMGLEATGDNQDEKLDEVRKKLKENIEICNNMKRIIEDKKNMLNQVDEAIENQLEKIIAKNNEVL